MKRIVLVVEGLFEKSDSIGFDCVYQYKILKSLLPADIDIRIYASDFDVNLYPGVEICKIEELYNQSFDGNTCLIYHFCDGWDTFEQWLPGFGGMLITRWHNNTPPWFFAKYSRRSVERTVRGYRSILNLLRLPKNTIACNSDFSIQQLEVLGARKENCCVVYPASRFLDTRDESIVVPSTVSSDRVDLLFVGRLVPHKGHRHILLSAAALKAKTTAQIHVHLPGRPDRSALNYQKELVELAEENDITLHIGGEISQSDLENLYRTATAFVCLSEHEGFGLPVFEAMQSGLPVIAWAGTALEEMIGHHPLAVTSIDYEAISGNILKVLDNETRASIVDWQNRNVLQSYRKSVVERQMLELLEPFVAGTHAKSGSNDESSNTDIPREIRGNYLTLHDLQTYEVLLDEGLSNLLPLPKSQDLNHGKDNSKSSMLLAPARFIIPDSATHENQSKTVRFALKGNAEDSREEYFIFGPYVRLPAGFYSAEFHLKISDERNAEKRVLVDVAADGVKVAYVEVTADQISRAGAVPLDFYVSNPAELIEFRVRCRVDPKVTLEFSGVSLSRVDDISLFGVNRRGINKTVVWNGKRIGLIGRLSLFARRAMFLAARYTLRTKKISAVSHFSAGDRARDERRWSDCLEHYNKGLRFDPARVDIWIQLGHAYKENGDYEDSQRAYAVALKLGDDDADIHLNIGHLMKLRDDRASAALHYLNVVQRDVASFEALRELLNLGLDLDEISKKLRPQ